MLTVNVTALLAMLLRANQYSFLLLFLNCMVLDFASQVLKSFLLCAAIVNDRSMKTVI